jgi:hypothetical protein
VGISARRLLDAASYGLRLSPPPRRQPVSHLRVAAERYKTAASNQHLDAVLARYRQKWITEPETLSSDDRLALVMYAGVAVREIVLHHPEHEPELSQLRNRIEHFASMSSDDNWECFRRELVRVLPDLGDPIDRESTPQFESETSDDSDQARFVISSNDFAVGLEEKGSGE